MHKVLEVEGFGVSPLQQPCIETSDLADEFAADTEICWGKVFGRGTWEQPRPLSPKAEHPRAGLFIGEVALANCSHGQYEEQFLPKKRQREFGFMRQFVEHVSSITLYYDFGSTHMSNTRRLSARKDDPENMFTDFATHLDAVLSGDPKRLPRSMPSHAPRPIGLSVEALLQHPRIAP